MVDNYKEVVTDDGSITFYNDFYQEKYHSQIGAIKESFHKFILPIDTFLKTMENISILDVGFGLGLNSFALLSHMKLEKKNLQIISLEKDKELFSKLVNYYANYSKNNSKEAEVFLSSLKILNLELKNNPNNNFFQINYDFFCLRVNHIFIIDDARKFDNIFNQNINKISTQNYASFNGELFYDFCFLDAFSSKNNTELWTFDFLKKITSYLKHSILTYSTALPVLNALDKLNLNIYKINPLGRKSPSILATKLTLNLDSLDEETILYLKSKSAIVYRDPNFNLSSQEIKKIQLAARDKSQLKSLSQLKKTSHLSPK